MSKILTRNIMLLGPPGCGRMSLAKSLQQETKFPVWNLELYYRRLIQTRKFTPLDPLSFEV